VDLGLYFYGEIMAGKDWTEEEIKYLKENGAIKSCKEIAEHLGRTVRATQHKFGQLGLEKRKAQVGDVINGWEIVEIYEKEAYGQKISMAKIKSTICNKSRDTKLTLLTNKKIKGPGKRATGKNMTHGETGTRLHRIWKAMRTRTKNANADKNNRYINRGIDCCKGWDDYIVFRDWSLENGYSDELSIDRIDNDKGYSPENCRWATRYTQAQNRSDTNHQYLTAFDETKDIYEWALDDRCVVNLTTLRHRINAGWKTKIALTKESERSKKI